MEASDAITFVRRYNKWRRGDDDSEMPHPKDIGESLDALCDHAERMERELEHYKHDAASWSAVAKDYLRERNDARETLMLAARWGIESDGYSANVSGAIRAWIINGMKGPAPKQPDYYPKP